MVPPGVGEQFGGAGAGTGMEFAEPRFQAAIPPHDAWESCPGKPESFRSELSSQGRFGARSSPGLSHVQRSLRVQGSGGTGWKPPGLVLVMAATQLPD